jgi:hypothetical protein
MAGTYLERLVIKTNGECIQARKEKETILLRKFAKEKQVK